MYKCDNCEDLFEEPIKIDEGIGKYEYWGAIGNDVQIVDVSPCCHESFTEVDEEK
jgi:hypothetical protein